MTDQTNQIPRGNEEELQTLLESYLKKSEELEEREGRVLRQIELMQSTVSSLQAWNENRKISLASMNKVPVDANEIEEETSKIKEETKRIQEEVKKKMTENQLLQQEIERRKSVSLQQTVSDRGSEAPKVDKPKKKEEPPKKPVPKIRALERHLKNDNFDRDVKFFDEKVKQLKEIEKKLRKESETRAQEARRRQMDLLDRIKLLEKESHINKSLINNLKNSQGKKIYTKI